MAKQCSTHGVHILVYSISSLLLLLASIFILPYASAHGPKSKVGKSPTYTQHTIIPQTSNDVLLNPGKGWVLYGSPYDQSASTMAYATVGYVRYDWSSIEPTEGQYNWSLIDNDLNAWVSQGKQFAFGVMNADSSSKEQYVTPHWVFADGAASVRCTTFDDLTGQTGIQYEPVWDNPVFLQKVKDFLAALAQRYDNNSHIAYIDVRSYGNWGEQHVYGISPSVPLSAAGTQMHIQMYKDAFKHTQIIAPWGTSNYNNTYDWAVNNGVGMRRDGMMVDSNGSELTRAQGKVPSVFEFYGSYQWLNQRGDWNSTKLRQEVEIGTPSYIGMGQWGNDAQAMLSSETTLIHDLANHMGYDFVLNRATIPTNISTNQAMNISLSWSNRGVSYLYKPASVAVALLDNSNNVVQKQWFTGSNPKAWTPGQTTTESAAIAFKGVNVSTYKLAVGLFQNTTDSNPTYKIGNQGRTANGWYVISNNTPVSSNVHCQILLASSPFSIVPINVCQRSRNISLHRSTRIGKKK